MTSIQSRLALWLLGSVLILMCLHLLVTSRAPIKFTEEYISTRLDHDAEMLINCIRFTQSGQPVINEKSIAPIYLRWGSGHYYQIQANDYNITSPSLGGEALDMSLEHYPEHSIIYETGPNNEKLMVWVSSYQKNNHTIILAVAEELTTLNEHIKKFQLRFGIITLTLFILLITAQRYIVKSSLKPLRDMELACKELEQGIIVRMPENVPEEIRPLSREINRLVDVMQTRLIRSRNALGNLAHALKTPLALLSKIAQDDDATALNNSEQARSSIQMIQNIIDRELKRARLAGPTATSQVISMHKEINSIVDLLKNIYADKALQYHLRFEPDEIRYGDREDMLELLGNLLDNASKWAKRQIRFSAVLNQQLTITIEDDGPGIPDEARQEIMQRGTRLDETTQGHGLGLAIIQDIVDQYDGSISLSTSTLGGLRVDVTLPV